MHISDILQQVKDASGTNAKKEILQTHSDNDILKKALKFGLDPFTPFNIVKVPKVKDRHESPHEEKVWSRFFEVAGACAERSITGNNAIDAMHHVFSTSPEADEKWMRKILKKHLAIGASTKTVNKIFPGLIETFDVSLAQKFDYARIESQKSVYVEPKLDGIRCFATVIDGSATLYARSGKIISNFDDTIGKELESLPDGCYDGEIMGEDFIALMRQAYRKESAEVEDTYLALFDYLPIREWKEKSTKMSCRKRYASMYTFLQTSGKDFKYLRTVERRVIASDYDAIMSVHQEYVSQGYEGAMVKMIDAPYKFGRGYEVMKLKSFHDVDLKVERLLEGTGKHSKKLGSVVVNYHGVEVQVGSGFSDELRDTIWADPSSFVGRTIEVRYQEVTPDGSLRFPTFVCFRNDRD